MSLSAPLVIPARSLSNGPATLIFLHGLGDSGHGWASTLEQTLADVFPSLRIVIPTAPTLPLTINGGQKISQWFDIKYPNSRDKPELQDLAGMKRTQAVVEGLIKKEKEEGRKVVLGGFSQGAVMTLFSGLQSSQHLEGLIILSGFLPQHETLHTFTSPILVPSRSPSFPVFLAHGTVDQVIAFDWGLKIKDFLGREPEDGGLGLQKVTWFEMAGVGHTRDAREMQALRLWLGGVLGWDQEEAAQGKRNEL